MSSVIRNSVIANAGIIVHGSFSAGDENCNDDDLFVTMLLPPGVNTEKMISDNKKAIIDLSMLPECNFAAEDFAKDRFVILSTSSIIIGDAAEVIQIFMSSVVSR